MVSLNVNGLNQTKKRREIFRYLRGKKPDILLIQETYSTSAIEKLWSNEWGRKIYFSHGSTNSKGVAVLLSKSFQGEMDGYWNDKEGRFLAFQFKLSERKIMCINLYAPNEDDPKFFEKVFQFLDNENHDFEEVIVGGDLNVTLDWKMDKFGSEYDNHKNKRQMLLECMENYKLCDIWRILHPNDKKFTWRRLEGHLNPSMSRLDYFLVSEGLRNSVTRSEIYPKFISDHGLISLEMDLEEFPRGPGYWKFNSKHLNDKDFVELITNCISEYEKELEQEGLFHSPDIIWEGLKAKIIAEAVSFSMKKAKGKKNLIEVLQQKLIKLDAKLLEAGNNIEKIKKDIRKTEDFILNEHEEDTLGAIFRSKSQYYELGDKPSAYFFNLEKSRSRAKTITQLESEDKNEILKDPGKILRELKNYYQKLYSSKDHSEFIQEGMGNSPKLPEEIKEVLEQPFTIEEISEALKALPNNKCPGLDGLTTEFYKAFWPQIKTYYFKALIFGLENGKLHQSARLGLIALLPKPNKEYMKIKNWRPITLMNNDYKLFSKALSLRLKEVMPLIIHEDQTGFMAGRDLSLNVRKTLDLINYAEINQIPAVIMQMDCEKAFDRLEWDIIWAALQFFNFGEKFIQYVKCLFEGAMCCVINGGRKSELIYPTRSVRQGCSTSPFLFILVYELVAIKIRENHRIRGIEVNGCEQKISQFADDMTLFLLFEEVTFREVVKVMDYFYQVAGIKVNYDKTTVYRIGSLKNSNAKLYTGKPFYWTNNPITILGIIVTHNEQELATINMVPTFEKIQNILRMWSGRNLSLTGRVTVVNNLISSLFIHKLIVLGDIHIMFYEEYNRLVKEFLWTGKPKMKLHMLYNSKEMGGLGLVNLENKSKALTLQWVSKCKTFSTINQISEWFFPIEHIWECNLSKADIKKMDIKSNFWKSVLLQWSEFHFTRDLDTITKDRIFKMRLDHNSIIKVGGKVVTTEKSTFLKTKIIGDLYKKDKGTLIPLSQQDLLEKSLSWNKILQFMGVSKAIPPTWNAILIGKSYPRMSKEFQYDFENIPKKLTNIYYKQITFKQNQHQELASKWNSKLGISIAPEDVDQAFKDIKSIISCTKLRDFQFRFLHRKIFTGYILRIWGLVESDRCVFCEDHYETMDHLFFYCHVTRRFLTRLQCWYEAMTDTEINLLDEKVILLNRYNENKITILDTILLMAKQYIFRCRCLGRDLDFHNFKDEMFLTCKIERRIATINNKQKSFCKKWGLFLK